MEFGLVGESDYEARYTPTSAPAWFQADGIRVEKRRHLPIIPMGTMETGPAAPGSVPAESTVGPKQVGVSSSTDFAMLFIPDQGAGEGEGGGGGRGQSRNGGPGEGQRER